MTITADTPAATSLFALIGAARMLGCQHRAAGLIPFGAIDTDDVAELFRSSLFLSEDRSEWETAYYAYLTVVMADVPLSADDRQERDYEYYREEQAL